MVQLYADDDSSFGAEVYPWMQDKNHLKATTGWCDYDDNAAAERSIRAMRDHIRTGAWKVMLEFIGDIFEERSGRVTCDPGHFPMRETSKTVGGRS